MSARAGELLAPDQFANRLHLVAVAFQRMRQLQGGARPHVPIDGQRPPRVALLELMADTISWSVGLEEGSTRSPDADVPPGHR